MQKEVILSPITLEAFESRMFEVVKNAIAKLNESPKVKEDQNLSITELAEYLKVSKPTIHSYKNQRLFPFYQAGRTVYFKKSEVDAAFANGKGRYESK